jgi:flagellar biosynthesis protein FlhA
VVQGSGSREAAGTTYHGAGSLQEAVMSDLQEQAGFGSTLQKMLREPTMIFAAFLIIVVLMLIIPLPEFMLDVFMSISIFTGLFIIVTVAYARKAVDFSIFPSLLLVTTLFRLAVNVSSTRLILSKGVNFNGKMVRAFGQFVVGSADAAGLVIGIIIFAILVIVQFIVITRGATRVSEVAARFSLDSMPNKYMAIDMDVQNGVIDEVEAIKRREEVQEESNFYGNMDGASKFVQGDVIVGIIITLVNIIGGLTVGMLVRGESLTDALFNYVSLTIGDGLVSQIPSLLISTATGLIVTRSQANDSIGKSIWKQTRQYNVFLIAGVALVVLAFLPGFPHIILFVLGAGLAVAGWFLYRTDTRKAQISKQTQEQEEVKEFKGPENVSSLLKIDPLSLYIGYELIPLVDKSKGAELLNSITKIRRNLAVELGVIVPPIRIQDNMNLLPNEYSFRIRGQEIGKHHIKTGYLMAMGEGSIELDGEKTSEPAYGLPAVWIREEQREQAESAGYTVVDPPTIISTHVQELLKSHAYEIVGREEVNKILDTIREDYPNLLDDILTVNNFSRSSIQKVLQQLLKEGVSIRDMVTILEAMSEHSAQTPVSELVEYVRQSMKRVICSRFMDDQKKMVVLRLDPVIENEIYKNQTFDAEGNIMLRLNPDYLSRLQVAIRDRVTEMFGQGYPPVILCQPQIRRGLWQVCYQVNRMISVVSVREIVADAELEMYAQIALVEEAPVSG